MTKVGAVLNYWIYIIVVLLVSKLLGLADDNKMMIIVVASATILYFPMIKIFSSRQERSSQSSQGKIKARRKK